MNEHKHTPGPWRIDFGDDCAIIAADDGDWSDIRHVARAVEYCGPRDAYLYNASLIAAAPDLLEALDHMCRIAPEYATQNALDAIAKARGQG